MLSITKRNIAFDLDGTLLDAGPRDYATYCQCNVDLGYVPLEYEKYWEIRRAVTPLHRFLDPRIVVSEYVERRYVHLESEKHLGYDIVFPWSRSVLQDLSKDHTLHLITMRYRGPEVLRQLKEMSLDDYFASIQIVSVSKHKALQKIDNILAMIGDTEKDIVAAKDLGIKSIAVSSGIRNKEYLQTLDPDHLIENICGVRDIINTCR